MNKATIKHIVRYLLKGLYRVGLAIAIVFFCCLLFLMVVLHTDWGTLRVQRTLTGYLSAKTGQLVSMGSLSFHGLSGFTVDQLRADYAIGKPIIEAQSVSCRFDPLRLLLSRSIALDRVELHKAVITVDRAENDSLFNYERLLSRFTENGDTAASTPPVVIGEATIQNLSINYDDRHAGRQISSYTDTLSLLGLRYEGSPVKFGLRTAVLAGHSAEIILQGSYDGSDRNNPPVYDTTRIGRSGFGVSDFRYDQQGIVAKMERLYAELDGRFSLTDLRGDFMIQDTLLTLDGIRFISQHTDVSGNLTAHYETFGELLSPSSWSAVRAELKPSHVRLRDFASIFPRFASDDRLRGLLDHTFLLSVQTEGAPDSLNLSAIQLQTGNVAFLGNASLTGILTGKPVWKANIGHLSADRASVHDLLDHTSDLYTYTDYLPSSFLISGKLLGQHDRLFANISLQGSTGQLLLHGNYHYSEGGRPAHYEATLKTKELDLSRILPALALSRVTTKGTLRGAGNNLATFTGHLNGQMQSMMVSGHTYHQLGYDIDVKQSRVTAAIDIADSRAKGTINADFRMENNTVTDLHVDGRINQIDLASLGYADRPLVISTRFSAGIPRVTASLPDAWLKLDSLTATVDTNRLFIDSLSLAVRHDADSHYLTLRSPVMEADLSATLPFTALPGYITETVEGVSEYLNDTISSPVTPSDTYLHVLAAIYDPNTFRPLLPDSLHFSTVAINGTLTHSGRGSTLQAYTPSLRWQSIMLDSLSLSARIPEYTSGQDSLHITAEVGKISYPARLTSQQASVRGFLSAGHLTGFLTLQPLQTLSFDFPLADHELFLTATAIDLATINSLLPDTNISLSGTANGNLHIQRFDSLRFVTSFNVDSLGAFGRSFGSLQAVVRNPSPNQYVGTIRLGDSLSGLSVDGSYDVGSLQGSAIAELTALPVQLLSPFTTQIADSLRGTLDSRLLLNGDLHAPDINGSVTLDSVAFLVKSIGATVQIPRATWQVADGLHLRETRLSDGAGGNAILTGELKWPAYQTLSYQLHLDAERFRGIGPQHDRDQLVSGNGYTTLDLSVAGDLEHAAVNGQVHLLDESTVRYNFSDDTGDQYIGELFYFAAESADGQEDSVATVSGTSAFRRSVNTDVKLDPRANMTIMLDESTGERVEMRGSGTLHYSENEGAGVELSGRYEIESGTYNLHLSGMNPKAFSVSRGSYLQWNGDPEAPRCHIVAVYAVQASAAALMTDAANYRGIDRQKLGFDVKITLTGELMAPEVAFEINLDEKQKNVYQGAVANRLKQLNSSPDELRIQVLALLAFNGFIGDNPFSGFAQAGSNLASSAANTAGKLLTDELNQFMTGAIKFVDITVGFDMHGSNGERRDQYTSVMKLGLGKSMLQHRLNIYVGNDFFFDPIKEHRSPLGGLADDVSVEYLITPDGRYRIRGYRVRDNTLSVYGTTVETGVNFTLLLDFDTASELFTPRQKR